MSDITTADKIWVVKRKSAATNHTPDLAYMSTIDKGHPSRAKTGLSWAGYNQYDTDWDTVGEIFDNTPVCDIEFTKVGTRYSTDNKVMQLRDPRGFEVQIYIDNLLEIIQHVTIENGKILTPLKWGRKAGNIYLMHQAEAAASKTDEDFVRVTQLPINSEFIAPNNCNFVYLGKRKLKFSCDIYQIDIDKHFKRIKDQRMNYPDDRVEYSDTIDNFISSAKFIESHVFTRIKPVSVLKDGMKQPSAYIDLTAYSKVVKVGLVDDVPTISLFDKSEHAFGSMITDELYKLDIADQLDMYYTGAETINVNATGTVKFQLSRYPRRQQLNCNVILYRIEEQ